MATLLTLSDALRVLAHKRRRARREQHHQETHAYRGEDRAETRALRASQRWPLGTTSPLRRSVEAGTSETCGAVLPMTNSPERSRDARQKARVCEASRHVVAHTTYSASFVVWGALPIWFHRPGRRLLPQREASTPAFRRRANSCTLSSGQRTHWTTDRPGTTKQVASCILETPVA